MCAHTGSVATNTIDYTIEETDKQAWDIAAVSLSLERAHSLLSLPPARSLARSLARSPSRSLDGAIIISENKSRPAQESRKPKNSKDVYQSGAGNEEFEFWSVIRFL